MENPPPIKKGRGRPRKIKPVIDDAQLPTIVETEPELPKMLVVDDPAYSFTEVVSLNGGIDLSDIVKQLKSIKANCRHTAR